MTEMKHKLCKHCVSQCKLGHFSVILPRTLPAPHWLLPFSSFHSCWCACAEFLSICFLDYNLQKIFHLIHLLGHLKKHLNIRNVLIIKSSLAGNDFGSKLPIVCVNECIYNDKILFI